MSSSSIVSHIYNSRKILLKLLGNQGYDIFKYDEFSVNEVNSMCQTNQLDMLLEKFEKNPKTNRKDKIYICYYLTKSIKPNNIQELIDDLFNIEETLTKDDILFIISKEDANETLVNLLKHIWEQDKIFIIIQSIKRLQYNILEHQLVPSHRVLNEEETNTIRLKYNIKNDMEFPEISRFDPVAQAIFIRPGEVCEIKRPSKTSINSLYYRICV